MGEPRKRRRGRLYVGGGVVLALLFLLGDPIGWFRTDEQGRKTGTTGVREDDQRGDADAKTDKGTDAKSDKGTDAELASHDPGLEGRPKDVPPGKPTVEPKDPAKRTANQATPKTPSKPGADPADVDLAQGILRRFERALRDQRLVELATLDASLERRPIQVPPALAEQFAAMRDRVAKALDFVGRLRGMVRKGEILAARDLLAPVVAADAPKVLRDRLQRDGGELGWPRRIEGASVGAPAAVAKASFDKLRRVRYRRDGGVHEARVWRVADHKITLRVDRVGGFAYPVLPSESVEAINPSPDEAFGQGLALARAGDALSVWLWSCFFHEHGDSARSARLQKLIQAPR